MTFSVLAVIFSIRKAICNVFYHYNNRERRCPITSIQHSWSRPHEDKRLLPICLSYGGTISGYRMELNLDGPSAGLEMCVELSFPVGTK